MEESGVARGTISGIHVENFVTYDDAVIKPGRNLNLIIGPNGTGKSTVVCAIVLGLGGKPKIIGRALHVSEYVKAGCQQAKIEIELNNPGKKNITVTRIFTVENNTTWLLNGKPSAQKEVENLIRSMNIQVDNLCQFLPQDKVQDFSKMNPQELLENTERSVGDPKLLEHHLKLKDLRKTHKDLEVQVANKKKLLETQMQKYERLKDIVGNIKEKKVIKNKIIHLKQKKAWVLYDETRENLVQAKKEKDLAAKKMNELRETLEPINKAIQESKNSVKITENIMQKHSNEVSIRARKVRTALENILACEENVRDIENTCERLIQIETTRDQEIAAAQQQKSKLENDMEMIKNEFGSEDTLAREMQNILPLIEAQRNEINKLLNLSNILKQKDEQIRQEIRAQEAELQQAKDVSKKRLDILRHRSSDAYKGVLWLRENKEQFRGMVHEPIQLLMNVKRAEHSKYLENIIPHRDLIAFVCEDKQDMNLLLKLLRDQQKLQINAVHSDPNRNISMNPTIPIENIRTLGFEHYLSSLFSAPETIMKYLVCNYRIHNIPVGTGKVEDCSEQVPASINCFFSVNNLYYVSTSKYTGAKSTRISRVTDGGTLSVILDTAKLNGITEKLKILKANREKILEHLKQSEDENRVAEGHMDELRSKRNNYQRNTEKIRGVKSRINMVSERLQDLKNNRTSVKEIQDLHQEKIEIVLKRQIKYFREYNNLLEEYYGNGTISEQLKFKLKLQQRRLVAKENESLEMKEKCARAERTYRRIEDELQPLRAEAKRMFDEALASTGGIGPQDKPFRKFSTAFSKLPVTVEEINHELRLAQAKVLCLGNNQDGENDVREFEKVTADVEKLKKDIERQTGEMLDANTSMENIRAKWLQPLEELVTRINENFSTYFAGMKCAGEVFLMHGENVMDFDQYGLKIRVKFRDSDELQELTRHHQSGGERAVTTAIYMIALQELSKVPFRCVDEINQGMDAINERRVFELIVRITGQTDSSQYFLLTPKLLPALLYTDTVTVHCVFNGPFMISHKNFDMDRYCRRALRMQEDEDSS